MDEEHYTHLIIRYLSHETSVEEEEALLEWVSKDPSNQRIFNDWIEIWDSKPRLTHSFDVTQGLARLNQEIDKSESTSDPLWRKIAAAILILITTSLTLLLVAERAADHSGSVPYTELKTTAGRKLSISLADGTRILLNANSVLKYPETFEDNKREIFLKGEAFLQVAKDSKRPFVIYSNEIETRVLGTSFNINARADSLTVSVVTGKVQVSGKGLMEVALPQEKIVYNAGRDRLTKSTANLDLDLAWKNNTIIFKDAKLSAVAGKLHEVFGKSFRFEKESLTKCLITGRFADEPMDAILQAISFSTGTQYRIRGDTVTIYGQGCD